MKKIAVLTSGGDSPGMNAAIRAVVRTGIYHGLEVYGVYYGYKGLIEDKMELMNIYSVSDIVQRGGTMLYSARCSEMYELGGQQKAAQTLKEKGIDGLVVVGGDGSYRGASALSKLGINVVTIPGTIDNDIPSTDYAIGFDTAVNTAIDCIGKIKDTSNSHNRVNVVQVMGRNSGNIALYAGIGGGAECIIIPEKPYSIEELCERMTKDRDRGKLHSIVVLAEGVGKREDICEEIERITGVATRSTNLGYIQRGGSPSAYDRILASNMGALAVDVLRQGLTNRAICIQNNQYLHIDIEEALNTKYHINDNLYELSRILSV